MWRRDARAVVVGDGLARDVERQRVDERRGRAREELHGEAVDADVRVAEDERAGAVDLCGNQIFNPTSMCA